MTRGPRSVRLLLTAALLALVAAACAPKAPPATTPIAPRFPDFVFPAAPAALAASPAAARHDAGWRSLQAGDVRGAARQFEGALKETPGFYPSEAGLGYVALARKDFREAVAHFDRALGVDAKYAPALVGRGEALLAAGDRPGALSSFEAAVAADPSLGALRARIDVLRFRGMQDDIAAARQAADAGRLPEARQIYERAIAASPESPFLHRELAAVERKAGNVAVALAHAEKASQLDPSDAKALMTIAEIHEAQGDFTRAADAYAAAVALEPNPAVTEKIEALRERAAFATMPPEFQAIETAPSITRAQLAALLGVHLDRLLKRAPRQVAVVMTDTRDSWAAPWILLVTRAGVMEPYPNHTFQPSAIVRRADLAAAASRALRLVAAERPRLDAQWRNARRRFTDVPPGHLGYPAASLAVEAGVMATLEDGSFQLSRPVTGAEAMAAVKTLRDLAESKAR